MSKRSQRPSNDDPEQDQYEQYDDSDEPGFQRIRSNTGKTPNIKSDRRQQAKEWGRMHAKFHKQRKSNKP